MTLNEAAFLTSLQNSTELTYERYYSLKYKE